MKSISSFVNESLDQMSKFITTEFISSEESKDSQDIAIGWIDRETRLEIRHINNEQTFYVISGSKYSDGSDKKSYSKSYDFIDNVPAKWQNYMQELQSVLNSGITNSEIDTEYAELLAESVEEPATNAQLLAKVIARCKSSNVFLKNILFGLAAIDTMHITEHEDRFVLEERSWFSAILTNAALYFAAIEIAKISTKWIRTLLLALVAERVITTNDIPSKLTKFLK